MGWLALPIVGAQSNLAVVDDTQFQAARDLLSNVVDSFEKLEIVVHLYRARFGAQTTATIAHALSLAGDLTAEVLSELTRAGVLRTANDDGAGWWFDPNGPWAGGVTALVGIYETDRLDVINLMTSLAIERASSLVAQRFANAFVLRPLKAKGKGNGKPDA